MERKHVLLGILALALTAGVAYSAVTTYTASQGVTYVTDSGVAVELGTDYEVQSGNPFDDSETFRLRNTTFSASGDASVVVDGLDPVDVSGVSTSGDWLILNNTDDGVRAVEFKGTADNLQIDRLNLSRENDAADISIDSTSTPGVRFNTSLAEDETVVAVDTATDTVIDTTQADSNGRVAFESLDSGTYDVNFQQGPSVLRVFNESNPDSLVDGNTTLRIRFFPGGGEEVVERQVTDGTVSLQGLPPDEEIVVTVDDSAGNYTYRRIILESLYQQQSIFLLPKTQQNIGVTFELNDKTGAFSPQNSRLFVEAPIRKDYDGDGTNETRYRTIVGDRFGADGSFPAVIQPNERYRLRVENLDGNSRVLGAYSASRAGIIEVPIGEVNIEGRSLGEASFGASLIEEDGSRYIRVAYVDNANATSELDLEIVGDSANASTIRPNTTESGPFGRYVETYPVPESDGEDVTYRVRFHAERDNAEDFGGTRYVGAVGAWEFPVDGKVMSLLGWVMLVGLTGGVVLVDDRLAAMFAPALATGLSVVGVLQVPMTALGIAGAIALLYNAGRFR